jgi:hypothetical protein
MAKKDKQWSPKHTHKTKDRVTQTPLKIGTELGTFHRCFLPIFFFIWQLSFRGEEFEDINQSETRIVSFFLPIKTKSAILIEDLPDDSYSY